MKQMCRRSAMWICSALLLSFLLAPGASTAAPPPRIRVYSTVEEGVEGLAAGTVTIAAVRELKRSKVHVLGTTEAVNPTDRLMLITVSRATATGALVHIVVTKPDGTLVWRSTASPTFERRDLATICLTFVADAIASFTFDDGAAREWRAGLWASTEAYQQVVGTHTDLNVLPAIGAATSSTREITSTSQFYMIETPDMYIVAGQSLDPKGDRLPMTIYAPVLFAFDETLNGVYVVGEDHRVHHLQVARKVLR